MLHQLSERITLFLLGLNLFEERDRDIYSYGMEIFLSSMFGVLLAIGIGIVFHETIRVSLFLISFISIRSYAGGYHAESHWKCISIFGVVSLISIYLGKLLEGSVVLLILLTALAAMILLIFAPLENENRRLDEEEKALFGRKSKKLVLTISGIILLGLFFGPTGHILSAGLSTGVLISGSSVFIAIIMERRKKHETAKIY